MKPIVKSKNVQVVGDSIVIKQETEQNLTMTDLQNAKQQIARKKQQLIQQSQFIKNEFDNLTAQDKEIDTMISALPQENIEVVG